MIFENVTIKRSDGRNFEFENDNWGVTELTGIEFPDIEVFTSDKGIGNGSIITGKRKEAREIELHAQQRRNPAPLPFSVNRTALLAFLNSNYTFDIYITLFDKVRVAKDCELTAASYPTVQTDSKNPELTAQFLSPEADLFGDEEVQTSFTTVTPLWHDTRIYTYGGGTNAFGAIELATTQHITYLGSEETPIIVTVTASGLVEGVTVTLNGTALQVEEDLSSGDVLIINCDERTITKNGSSIDQSKIDAITMMNMRLKYGTNEISVESSGNTAYTAEVSYTGRYGGI